MSDRENGAFAIGDILQLKSGGVAMTAGLFDPKRGRQCVWSVKDDLKEKFLDEEMLRPVQDDRSPPPVKLALDYSLLKPHEMVQLRALIEKATPKHTGENDGE
jgi:uncharacterized protein YodC (DUF2158 family)